MIESIYLKNFQSHTETFLDLSPGVNIINGATNEGKSAILRALKWVFFNRPMGDSFRSKSALKVNESTEVFIKLKEGWVKRVKSDDENYYSSHLNSKFSALRGAVPDEIKNIIKIEDLNFQGQFDKLFLLDQPAAQVGKYLNKVLSLSIIDQSIKTINSIARENKKQFEENKSKEKQISDEIKKFHWLQDYEQTLQNTEILNADVEAKQKILIELKEKQSGIQSLENRIDKINKLLGVKSKVVDILNTDQLLKQKNQSMHELKTLVKKYHLLIGQKKELLNILNQKDFIETILNQHLKLTNLKTKYNEIQKTKSKLQLLDDQWELQSNKLDQLKKNYLKETRGFCPLCQKKL